MRREFKINTHEVFFWAWINYVNNTSKVNEPQLNQVLLSLEKMSASLSKNAVNRFRKF